MQPHCHARPGRAFLAAVSIAATLAAVEAQPMGNTDTPELAHHRQERAAAAHRRRRIIFNNDGDDHLLPAGEYSREAFLAQRSTAIVGSQVDTIVYCTSRPFGVFLHNTAIGEVLTAKGVFRSSRNNVVADMLAQGTDPLRTMIDFCREHGLEIIWSMRMNDTHDASHTPDRPHYYWSRFKEQHPEALVGSLDRRPTQGTWAAVDYTQPVVRDFLYRVFEELCRNYDIDGIEMDFFRHPCLFRSVAWGGEASPEERDLMTDLVRRIRAMTEREGLRRGRPILLTMRVPDSVPYARGIGLDIEAWLREGLIDILCAACYFQLNPWQYLVDLGHRHGVPVYPVLSDTRVTGETRFRRRALESSRGRAAQGWAAGADGIYLFNHFNPRDPIWNELGDPQALKARDKLYFVTMLNGSPDRYLKGGTRLRHLPVVTPSDVCLLEAGRPTVFEVEVAEDLTQPILPRVVCHVQVLGPEPVSVSVNDVPLADRQAAGDWLDFAVPVDALRSGLNRIAIAAPKEIAQPDEDAWTVTWRAGEMPGAEWQKTGWTTGCVAELQDDGLLIADRSTEGGSWGYFRHPAFIDPARETVIEARLKAISGENNIIIENGVSREIVQVLPGEVRLRYVGVSRKAVTDDGFHTYRIVARGADLMVSMDGQPIVDGKGKFTSPGIPGSRGGMAFGAASSGTTGEALWQMVRVRNLASTLMDVVLSVDYPAP